MTSNCVEINGWPIWYEKVGTGPMPLLLIPGALGTGMSDFYEQLVGDDSLDQKKFTIIAVEAPGWGRSKPPARPYGTNIYKNDVDCFVKLMQHLGYEKFSVIGWSDGAIDAIWMGCSYPDIIERMAINGIISFLNPKTLSILKSTRNVEGWGKEALGNYLRSYKNKEEVQQLWDRHLKYCEYFNSYFPKDHNKDNYKNIKFPLLVIHGDRDPISQWEHPEYLLKNIPHAKLHRFPNGQHNLHIKYCDLYKTLVEDFLLN